ncbi:hypothetical protein HPP92_013947 [Vanilla planifolia]|uniref:Small auxin up regulated protein n=1 Tax=Vanilla planifolia TaxID=51239 RepID=A0A835QJ44_VANPL|nr:hypothetical protein HPP92_014390 [Vanilla planifolia]KAG0474261.1 hypothetical protein HPP92_013947 [Vanilla planifolia]
MKGTFLKGQNHQDGLLGLGFQGKESLPPKGWLVVRVGEEEREQQRFLVPIEYLRHPLFVGLLKQSEKEYGFQQKGAITIPCNVEHFQHVRKIIERDSSCKAAVVASSVHNHLPLHLICFRGIS